jgi:hypothetical protein
MAQSPAPLPKHIACYALLAHPQGKTMLDDLETAFGFNSPVFIPDKDGRLDTLQAARRDGAHDVIRRIKDRLNQTQNYGQTTQTTVIKP